ncbi:ammonium transporter [Vibrio alginolyticus]|uniref:ammonium transporter n=1 Tax=Vibrio alginolyticus TaxID=663 RepID=UPI001EE9F6C8|nr:ammonium transporter [Vibrio alginolyticus]MCG6337959.1 ammonium transporter [Vibrio alginolyticus]
MSVTANQVHGAVQTLTQSSDTLFLLLGAIMVFLMHAGFAFLEVGTVRQKNQVNALVKILADFGISAIAYFFIGYWVAYGGTFFADAETLSQGNGYELVKFFFLLTFAAAIPAIVSGGTAERRSWGCDGGGEECASVGIVYPLFEGMIWNGNFGVQAWFENTFGYGFHDFAGSVVVHGVGGWIALVAVVFLGMRKGRVRAGKHTNFAPSNIPFLALGAWILCVGWFGFNVMSAQTVSGISGLVAMNSLMAMVGGIVASLLAGKNDPGFIHNGPLAGLVAVCAGSDLMHPIGALVTGAIAGVLFVYLFTHLQNKTRIDDVLGVWPLHGVCGAWGGIAAGIFGQSALGGLGGVSIIVQLLGTLLGLSIAALGALVVYGAINTSMGLRLSEEDEFNGADLAIHKISSTNED